MRATDLSGGCSKDQIAANRVYQGERHPQNMRSKLRRGYVELAIASTMPHELARQALPSGRRRRPEIAKRYHDQALFKLAIESKLRGCNLIAL
ncbi:hypothetical protein [Salipiger pallidus]|uniref:hypothetical protein n=1 Tax=Salipiger pallidus TaxID=1775170 RepID=UPI00166B38D7|nr:hypothetical protein [Salipiger pallidus]